MEIKHLFGQENHDLDLVFAQQNGKSIWLTEMVGNYRKVVDVIYDQVVTKGVIFGIQKYSRGIEEQRKKYLD